MVVGAAWEHELTCKQLKKRAASSPDINSAIERRAAEDNLRRAIEWRHQNVSLGFGDLLWRQARAKVAQFDAACVLRNHDVIRLQVSMDQFVPVQKAQGNEKLTPVEHDSIEA